MHLYLVFYLINLTFNIVVCGVLGIFLLFTTRKTDPSSRWMANVSLAIVMWAFLNFLALVSETKEWSFVLVVGSFVGLVCVPITFSIFSSVFAGTITGKKYRFQHIYSVLGPIFILLLLSDVFFHTGFIMRPIENGILWTPLWPERGPFFEVYLLYFSSVFVLSCIVLSKARKNASSLAKKQIDLIIWPTIIAAVGGISQYLIWYKIIFPPVGGFLISVYAIFVFYAITRFRLFNTKVITAEVSTIVIWMLLLGRILIVKDPAQLAFDVGLLVLSVSFGLITIRSVLNEEKQKTSLDEANKKLADLNQNLEARVAAQTAEIRTAYEVEKKARIELEELDKDKDQFILTAQHHLRTPLTVIKGFIQMALDRQSGLDSDTRTYLVKASDASEKMKDLINDFLNISQVEVGKALINPEPSDIASVIEEIRQELKPNTEQKHLSFEVVFTPEASALKISADRRIIKSAFFNLIDNAVKYTKEGGILISGSVFVHPIEKKRFLRIEIKDTGIGMEKGDISRIFSHYFDRTEEAKKMYATGRGLGLALSKNMIHLHGGKISVDSEGPGKGSTFTVELPAL